MRKVLIIIACALLLIACGSKEKKNAAPDSKGQGAGKPPPMKVDAWIVKKEIFQETLEVPGSLVANEVAEIHPEVSGRIVQLNITEGKYVSKGSVLARLYDGDLQAQLRKVMVQLELAQKTEERQAQLLKIQGISQQDYDISLLQVNNLRADIGILQTSIAKTVVRAPFSGKIGLNKISPGSYVTSSTVIASISQTDQLKLDFSIPEKYTSKIIPGQEVIFSIEGNSKSMTAVVAATESNITENTRTLTVRASVKGADKTLLPGAFAKVKVRFQPDSGTLRIPSEAVVPQARGKKAILYKGGTAFFADIVTGPRDSARIQVIQGLAEGDTVVVTGLMSIRPEAKIQLGKILNSE